MGVTNGSDAIRDPYLVRNISIKIVFLNFSPQYYNDKKVNGIVEKLLEFRMEQ